MTKPPQRPPPRDEVSEAREQITRKRILDAVRRVAAVRGFFEAEVADILIEADVSRSTFYRYFTDDGRSKVLRLIVEEIRDEAESEIERLLREVEDGAERMVAWMRFAFDQVERFGMLAVQLAAGAVPVFARDIVDIDLLHRFIGRNIKDCQAAGHFRDGVDVRHVVHTYIALVHPDHFLRRRHDGRSVEEIMEETMVVFFSAFAKQTPDLA